MKADIIGLKLDYDVVGTRNGKVYAKSGDKFNIAIAKNMSDDSVKKLFFDEDYLIGKFLATDLLIKPLE